MMTQALLSTTNMDQIKLTFDDVYCEAEVDTLQIGCDTDSCTLSKNHDDEKSKENEKPKKSADNVNTFHAARRNKMKRKPRRQRNKSGRQAPYSMPGNEVAVTRVQKSRRGRAQAPDNTTQFLMGDMDNWNKRQAGDEDGDNCYAKREFSKEYEKTAISKQKMPISKLIEEYFSYESEVKDLEKKYQEMTAQEQLKARLGAVDYEWEKGEIFMEPEVAEKIRIFQSEIARVREENRILEEENLRLRTENRDLDQNSSSSSSDDSSSDSDSSGSSDDSDSDSSSSEEEEETDGIPIIEEEQSVTSTDGDVVMAVPEVDTRTRIPDDTGYESGGSSNDAARVSSTTLRK